jgi:hypothetical protein
MGQVWAGLFQDIWVSTQQYNVIHEFQRQGGDPGTSGDFDT